MPARVMPMWPRVAADGVTKMALHRLYRQLNAEGLVPVGSLSPGLVDTEGVRDHVPARHHHNQSERPYHDHRPFAFRSNYDGYRLTRRRRAALPAVAGLAFALEVLLPALAPAAIFLFLSVVGAV